MNGELFWISYVLLWLMTGGLGVFVVLIYRQVGLVYLGNRTAIEMGGVPIGREAPPLSVVINSQNATLSWETARDGTVAIFSLPVCPMCAEIAAGLPLLAERWSSTFDFVWIDRTSEETRPSRFASDVPWTVSEGDQTAFALMDVRASPYVYVVDGDGIVLARSLVNTIEHVEELLALVESKDKGLEVASSTPGH
jgi:hypothetical protein